jgi:hypothetical protein
MSMADTFRSEASAAVAITTLSSSLAALPAAAVPPPPNMTLLVFDLMASHESFIVEAETEIWSTLCFPS